MLLISLTIKPIPIPCSHLERTPKHKSNRKLPSLGFFLSTFFLLDGVCSSTLGLAASGVFPLLFVTFRNLGDFGEAPSTSVLSSFQDPPSREDPESEDSVNRE